MSKTHRLPYIDVVRGILICWILWVHSDIAPDWAKVGYRLPFFYFISGFLFRAHIAPRLFFEKKIKGIFIPYLFFYALGFLYNLPIIFLGLGKSSDIIGWDFFYVWLLPYVTPPYNGPIWFLYNLLLVQILFWIANQLSANKYITIFIALLFYLSLRFLEANVFEMGSRVSEGFLWVAIGGLFKSNLKHLFANSKRAWIVLLCSCSSFLLLLHCGIEHFLIEQLQILSFVFLGISLIAICVKWYSFPLFKYYGTESLMILGFHASIIGSLKLLLSKFSIDTHSFYGIPEAAITLIVLIPIIKLAGKYIPKLVGKYQIESLQKDSA